MNQKSTSNYYVEGYDMCSYCNTHIYPSDLYDGYGGYCGSYYQCDCEKAKIEYQMNDEIQALENQIEEIRRKYAHKLTIDQKEINKTMYEYELERLKEKYSIDQPEIMEDN